MPSLHYQMSSAAQDVESADCNQGQNRSETEGFSCFAESSGFPAGSDGPCPDAAAMDREQYSDHNWFHTFNLECFADFPCISTLWQCPSELCCGD